jgi:hypothetical protein
VTRHNKISVRQANAEHDLIILALLILTCK